MNRLLLALPIQLDFPDGTKIPIAVRTSTRSRRLRIVCNISGVQLVLPSGNRRGTITHTEVEAFIQERKSWILRNYKYYEKIVQKCGPHEPGTLYYSGEKYRISLVRDRQHFVTVSESMRQITFHVRDLRDAKKAVKEWYRAETRRLVTAKLPELAARHGLQYNRVLVKDLSSRWGSCSRQGNLNFSLLLCAAPREVAEYVLIHELMHLVRLDHSRKFWELVAAADPEYKKHRAWLVDHAPVIKIDSLTR